MGLSFNTSKPNKCVIVFDNKRDGFKNGKGIWMHLEFVMQGGDSVRDKKVGIIFDDLTHARKMFA